MVYYFFYKCNLCFSLLYLVLSTHLCSTLLFDPQCTLLFHCSADILLVSILVCSALNYHNTLYLSLLYSIFLLSTSWFQSAVLSSSLFPSPLLTVLSSPLFSSSLFLSPLLFSSLPYSTPLPYSCPLPALLSTSPLRSPVLSFALQYSPLLCSLPSPFLPLLSFFSSLLYSTPFHSAL